MDLKLKNKTALITGSSRGLGYAIAELLSREGATVILNSRSIDDLKQAAHQIEEKSNNKVLYFEGDVTEKSFSGKAADFVAKHSDHLDILFTNAGGPRPGSFESFNDDDWQSAIDLTFLSHVRIIQNCLPLLRKSSCPSVITITSYSVKQPIPNLVLSNSIRAATVGLTKTLALELGHEGIRFNSILPGWTQTERVTQLMKSRADKNGTTIEEEIQKQAAESPFGRMATPEELANVAVFLASPAASYLTGLMLPVDGGMIKGTF